MPDNNSGSFSAPSAVNWFAQLWPMMVAAGVAILAWGTLSSNTAQNSKTIDQMLGIVNAQSATIAVLQQRVDDLSRADLRFDAAVDTSRTKRDGEIQQINNHIAATDGRVSVLEYNTARAMDRLEKLANADARKR